jgi:hypothetical protein
MKFRGFTLAAILLLWMAPAFGQACSMCYSTAKATSKEGQLAISRGVFVLLLPPLGIMTFGVWSAFRYGKKRDLEQSRTPDSQPRFRAMKPTRPRAVAIFTPSALR